MKRILASVLATIMLVSSVISLTGCGTEKVHILTRGEWISEIADMFGLTECYDATPKYSDVKEDSPFFKAIQACAEWEIIDDGNKFKPNDRADVTFGIVTAVKAVGLDKIEKAVNGKNLKTDKEIIAYFNEYCDVKYIAGSNLYMDVAEQILIQIGQMYASLQLKQYQDVAYTSNTIITDEKSVRFGADGETLTIMNGSYNEGDIVVIEPCTNYPYGQYAKIVSIDGNVAKYVEPTIDEMYDHVTIYGTYEPEILGVIPMTEGVEVNSIDGVEVEPQTYSHNNSSGTIYVKRLSSESRVTPVANTYNLGNIDLKINKTLGVEKKFSDKNKNTASLTIEGNVKLKNIKATVDLDCWGPVLKSADINVTETIESRINVSGKLEKTITMAKVPCTLWGTVGVEFIIAIKIGVEGSVSVVVSVDAGNSVNYKMFKSAKFHAYASDPNVDIELKAKAYVKPEFKAEFVIGPISVASIGAYSGFEAYAKTLAVGTSDNVSCIDISGYVPLAIFVGAEESNKQEKGESTTLFGKLGIQKSWTIWTASTSPVKKNWHIEDGEVVEKCTKKNKDKDKEEQIPNVEDIEVPEIDTEFIDFINELDTGLIISSFYVLMDEGNTDTLKVTQLPEGYDVSSIQFSTSDESVASVNNNGMIIANSPGSCVITVSTSDGKYEQVCAIRVSASYDVEFTPLDI